MKNEECSDAVIIFLKNAVEPFVKAHEPWRAVSLLKSPEIIDVLNSIERIECDDFMLPYVNDLRYQVEEDMRWFSFSSDLTKYDSALDDYEDYTEICASFMFGESNTVLAAIYNDLVEWRNSFISSILGPSLPVYKHLIDRKNLPF